MMTTYRSLLALGFLISIFTIEAIEGTFLLNPRDLELTNVRILAERPMGDRTEIEFTLDARNTESGVFHTITVDFVLANAVSSMTAVDSMLQFPTLGSLETVAGDAANTLIVSVANSDLGAARAQILNGSILTMNAMEVPVYSGPSRYIDAAMDNGFTGTAANPLATTLVFSNNIASVLGLAQGDIILADPATGAYRPKGSNTFNAPYLAQYIPFEVASVTVVGDRTHVTGNKRTLEQVIRSGSFIGDTAHAYEGGRDPYDPLVENTYTEAEKAARALLAEVTRAADPNDAKLADLAGLNAIPVRFNKVRIGEAIDLSGEILLRSSGLKFEVTIRDFAIRRAVAHIDAGLVANILLETVGTNNNVAVPIAQKEVELIHVPFPPVPINIAGIPMSLGGNFSVRVGAEAMAPGGISVPIQSAILVGAELGWDGEESFVAPVREFIKPRISDPTLYEAVELSARAWAEAKFELTIGDSLQLVSAGPSLAVRAEGEFSVNPLANPWWNLDFRGELVGAFNLNFLTLNVVGVDSSFWSEPFYHADSEGPLIAAAAEEVNVKKSLKAETLPVPDLRPLLGRNSRWGIAFQPKPNQLATANGFVIPLEGGDILTAGSSALAAYLARFRADGSLVWCQNFASLISTVSGAQLRDGRIAILGKHGLDWFLAFYDTDGNRLSVRRHNIGNSMEIRDMAVSYNEADEPKFAVVGYINGATVRDSDPFIIILDQDGETEVARVLTMDGDDEVHAVEALRDGSFALAGTTDANVGTDPLLNIIYNGLLMKVSASGDLIWANAVASYWGMKFNDVVEAPDGTLFAAGAQSDLVWNYYPDIAVAKFSSDGTLLQHVLLGEDPDWEDELEDAGDTPYDAAAQIEWTEDGLFLAGHTGLGTETAGWVAAMTEELGVKWFSSFDGSRADVFQDLAATDDGLLVMGWSDSLMPFGTGGEHAMVLFKYPWEGIVRMHPDTGAEMKYLQPRTFLSAEHAHFIGIDNSNPDQPVAMLTAPVAGQFQTLTNNETFTAVPTGTVVTPEMARLERIEPTTLRGFPEWAAYHQLGSGATLTGDFDGDGRTDAEEFFFGTNPHVADESPAPQLTLERNGNVMTAVLQFPIATWATIPPVLRAASDLNGPFETLTGFLLELGGEAAGSLRQAQIRYDVSGQPQLFFRVGMMLE